MKGGEFIGKVGEINQARQGSDELSVFFATIYCVRGGLPLARYLQSLSKNQEILYIGSPIHLA